MIGTETANGHLPCKAAHERHKLIQVCCAGPTDKTGDDNNEEPEEVLEPLDAGTRLAAANKETILHDPHSREQLQWHREHDSYRIEELNLK